MSSPSRLSPWPQYPEIPIFLETSPDPRAQKSYGTTEQLNCAPEIVHQKRSPRFLTVRSPVHPTNFSLKVPNPDIIKKSPRLPQLPRRPPLRYFLDKVPRKADMDIEKQTPVGHQVRFDEISISPRINRTQPQTDSHPSLGLGIVDAPPYPSSTSELPAVIENEPPSNLAQRFEKRIWDYNSSGNIIKRWLLEIISWILSALCMGVIVGTLIYLEDEKVPSLPSGLTLNAFISILSKVAGASLLLPTSEALGQLKWSWFQGHSKKFWDFEIFDNASRGPWGSILLLIRTKGKALAALGALVTLFSLALDPFFQQVVEFPDRWMCDGNGMIPTIIKYDPRQSTLLKNGRPASQQDQQTLNVAERFFYDNGTQPVFFGNGTRAEIPLSCPTSNCTWEPYETLGVCSKCVDVSQLLTFACLSTTIDWVGNLTGASTTKTYPNGTMCGYFLNATSENPVLMSGYNIDPITSVPGSAAAKEALLMRSLPLTSNPSRKPLYGNGSINFSHVRNRIADVVVAGVANGAAGVYRNETPVAHECVVAWCVKTIQSSYYWATYEETVLDEFIDTDGGWFPFTFNGVNGTLDKYDEDVAIKAASAGNDTAIYGLSNLTATRVINIFDDIFPSFFTAVNTSATPFLRFRTNFDVPTTRSLDFNPWLPPHNITHHMGRLATAMTNAIRSSASIKNRHGKAYSKETYVSIRWQWLTLPLGLLLLSLLFLIATIVKTSREQNRGGEEQHRVGVWKTSAIAMLMYGLPDDMQKKMTTSTSRRMPKDKVKDMKIKLSPERGWRISGNNPFSPRTPKIRQSRPPPTPEVRQIWPPPGFF